MNFELTPEEQLLKETVADFADSAFGSANVARSPAVDWWSPWQTLTEMGLSGLLVPACHGGSGGTLVDACIVAEELAKANAYLPFVGSAVVSVMGLQAGRGDGEALARAAQGVVFSTLVNDDLELSEDLSSLAFDWRPDATLLHIDQGGLRSTNLGKPESVDFTDFAHPIARFPVTAIGTFSWTPELRVMRASGWVALAAWLNGVAGAALNEAVEYARTREQFGMPIGSFQAIQHLCAEMLVDVETSRSMTYGAAWTVSNGSLQEAEAAAAAAKAWSSTTAVRVCEGSIQVFGGIGITWEHCAHLRLRTADQFRQALGTPEALARLVAEGRGLVSVGTDGSA
jgi:alkylation response protein AidB-like acyl-CoA dehydrogenase